MATFTLQSVLLNVPTNSYSDSQTIDYLYSLSSKHSHPHVSLQKRPMCGILEHFAYFGIEPKEMKKITDTYIFRYITSRILTIYSTISYLTIFFFFFYQYENF